MPGRIPKVDEGGHFPNEVVASIREDIGWTVIEHGSVATTPRPNVKAVYWIGTVIPLNMTSHDFYNGPSA